MSDGEQKLRVWRAGAIDPWYKIHATIKGAAPCGLPNQALCCEWDQCQPSTQEGEGCQ